MDLGKINKRRREEVETYEEREDDRDVGQIPITNPIDQVRLLREKYLISNFLSNSQDANRICITYG